MEGQDTQQWPLSRWEDPSVKCVLLQFEKVESGQIGALLSSCCRSSENRGGGARVCTRGLVPPLIDSFSSSQRGVKPSVVLENGIPGQTGCLYGDVLGGGGGLG